MRGTPWTDDQVATLIRLRKAGLSNSKIGDAVGKTRDSVNTKIRLLGLPKRTPKTTQKQHASLVAKQSVSASPARKARPESSGALPVVAEPPRHPETMARVPFMETKPGQCRFPLWGRDETTGDCCGNKAMAGRPYCEAHHRMTRVPVPKRRKGAADKFNFGQFQPA
ncbi:GcrA family cell cycle regulator [Methyloceanibacter caenitepidi]|uniref:GcrA cell cycle regulator n=1 Tax=Methyloceanibacter caenitepidi TaxID=1384459 RepID=A0A0A8K6E9_9HYPH|nr:GcrA family cell cycle regulator [Methyloceanibacter caenitepidi]BAQ18341.1 hypothetical protein GL4_2908 [Methyloceanibacter caenitepidi]